MKTTSKLFGGSHILHMTCRVEKQKLLEHIYAHTGIVLPEKSKQHKLLSNSNFSILKNGYYALAVPKELDVYIYFTRYNGCKMCFLICRNITAGHIQPKILLLFPECVNDDIYSGTLIQASRVMANDQRFFILMTDIIWNCGVKVISEKYIQRLIHLGNIMETGIKENLRKQPFRLQIVCPYEHLNLLEARINNLPYKVDQILFYPSLKNQSSLYFPL
tara:strand:+ start:2525 stop:3178 length:654 start_codon:yes stop_codon:yes gene_type:complete